MEKLNLPDFNYTVRNNKGKVEIFDIIRKKYIVLQPEEWVRQNFIHFLIDVQGFPKSLIKVESGLKYNSLLKRSDILIYSNDGDCSMLVECKSYNVKINQSTLDQCTIYNKTINAEYIILTNGINHFCCKKNKNGSYDFVDYIPFYKKKALE